MCSLLHVANVGILDDCTKGPANLSTALFATMSIPGDDEKAATVDDEKATTVDDKKATRIPEDKPTAKKTKTQFRTVRLGIWEVFLPVRPGWNLGNVTHPSMEDLKAHLSTFMLLSRLFQDIYALAPRKFVVFILAELAKTFESSVKLYLDSRIWYAVRGLPLADHLLRAITN